jgi:hypothetical protein
VLRDDLVLPLLHRSPIDGKLADAADAELPGGLHVFHDLGVKQQGLGRDAPDMQACTAQLIVPLDEGGFESPLSGADGGGVTGRAAADDRQIVNVLSQGRAPLMKASCYKCERNSQVTDCTPRQSDSAMCAIRGTGQVQGIALYVVDNTHDVKSPAFSRHFARATLKIYLVMATAARAHRISRNTS